MERSILNLATAVTFAAVTACTYEEPTEPVAVDNSAVEKLGDSSLADSAQKSEPGGEAIAVPSDPGVDYHLVSWQKLPNGNLEAVTRRKGSSGTSFARREISCEAMTFRYLGEGDTLPEAMRDSPNPGELAELTEQSISTYVSQFVCAKAG